MYRSIEWPTLILTLGVYGTFALAIGVVLPFSFTLGLALMVFAGVLHSSLTHEILHGHPFKSAFLNALLVFPAFIIFVPYLRFKDTHLDHHRDKRLTDPYDDPETNFLDPLIWANLLSWRRYLYLFNNTLFGRMFVGPILSQIAFLQSDFAAICLGNTRVLLGWVLHVPALGLAYFFVVEMGQISIWIWILAAYLSMAVLKIRTYLEHRVHDHPRGRSVVVEDRGILSFLFLNNNYHSVHHAHPSVPWYMLPKLFCSKRSRFLTMNDGYYFNGYSEIFRKFIFCRKDPVAHPTWSKE